MMSDRSIGRYPYPIENYGHMEAQDYPYVSGVGAQLAGAVPVVYVEHSGAEGRVPHTLVNAAQNPAQSRKYVAC